MGGERRSREVRGKEGREGTGGERREGKGEGRGEGPLTQIPGSAPV